MFGKLFKRKNKHFSASFKKHTVEYNGETYDLRELSVHETKFFIVGCGDESYGPELAAVWALSTVCEQFKGETPDALMAGLAPQLIVELMKKIYEISRLGVEFAEEDEKKSESSPN